MSSGFQLTPAKREPEFYSEPLKRQKTISFPVNSISDFKALRDRGYFYVDKTKYIKEIERDRDVLMFLRPKRFGKSLWLSTLKYFYDINETKNFERLFGSLDIYKHASELQHNRFLILSWNFSKVQRCTSIKETNQSLTNHINESIKDFYQNYAPILGSSKDFEQFINVEDCLVSIENLFRQVRLTPYKVYLLVDECDASINEFLDPDNVFSYQQLRDKVSLMKAIFAIIKEHCSKAISRVFITGVCPFSMNDVTSGFNIQYDITLQPTYANMCGFMEEDIHRALEFIFAGREGMSEEDRRNNVNTHLQEMHQYYNGYKFGIMMNSVYNTNLCLDYLQRLLMKRQIPLVDANNELSKSVLTFIGKHPESTFLLAQLLDNKETSCKSIEQNMKLHDLTNIHLKDICFLKSFLFYFGALTFTNKPNIFHVPNTVITKTIVEHIIELCHIHMSSDHFKDALNNLVVNDNIDSLCCYLERNMKNMIKRGNLFSDNKLVIKMLFHCSLKVIPHYLSNTEVKELITKVYSKKVQVTNSYIDLLITETKPVSRGEMPKHFIIEFKSKDINFLNLPDQDSGYSWENMEKADIIEKMQEVELLKLKTNEDDKHDQNKTMQEILEGAAKQLKEYVEGLKYQDQQQKFTTSAFIVLAVGLRRFIWRKIDIRKAEDGI